MQRRPVALDGDRSEPRHQPPSDAAPARPFPDINVLERAVRYVDILSDAATLTIANDREGHRLILELFGVSTPSQGSVSSSTL